MNTKFLFPFSIAMLLISSTRSFWLLCTYLSMINFWLDVFKKFIFIFLCICEFWWYYLVSWCNLWCYMSLGLLLSICIRLNYIYIIWRWLSSRYLLIIIKQIIFSSSFQRWTVFILNLIFQLSKLGQVNIFIIHSTGNLFDMISLLWS